MSSPPLLAEPEDPMERMTEEEWSLFRAWAAWGLTVLLLVLALVIHGAKG